MDHKYRRNEGLRKTENIWRGLNFVGYTAPVDRSLFAYLCTVNLFLAQVVIRWCALAIRAC